MKCVKSQIELIELMQNMNAPQDVLSERCKKATDRISETVVNSCKFDTEIACQLLHVINNSKLGVDDKQRLASVVTSRLENTAQKCKAKLQNHLYLHGYLTAKDWEIINAETTTKVMKGDAVIRRMLAIGLRNPSEKSFALAWALACSSSSALNSQDLEGLRWFKNLFKSVSSRSLALCAARAPEVYPEDVQEFKVQNDAWYRTAYTHEVHDIIDRCMFNFLRCLKL